MGKHIRYRGVEVVVDLQYVLADIEVGNFRFAESRIEDKRVRTRPTGQGVEVVGNQHVVAASADERLIAAMLIQQGDAGRQAAVTGKICCAFCVTLHSFAANIRRHTPRSVGRRLCRSNKRTVVEYGYTAACLR